MAQSIILKRSALPGKVPTTGSLNAGEIAVNTYDGKLFIKRSGNVDSIEGIVVTNSTTTGSITLTRTGSFGELVVTQDANISRDLYVTNDIIGAGDIDITGDITGSSALLSGSLILSGSQTITNNLTVLGTVNARQFNISVISSSVLFQSGSTKFGDTSDDTHQFTGSVSISGSLIASIAATNGVVSGSSQVIGILSSLNTFSGSTNTRLTALEVETSNLELFSGSQLTKNTALATLTGSLISSASTALTTNNSQGVSITNLNTFSGSQLTKNSTLATYTASVDSRLTQLSTASGSALTRLTALEVETLNLEGFTSSIDTTIKSKLNVDGVISGSSQLTSSFNTIYALSGSSAGSGPNTFDFNLDPEAAGTVNFIEDSTSNTQAIARTGSFDVTIASNTYLSISSSAMNVTTGSITANYMHLAKYITTAGDLDFNI
jgi:hypothetical protein